MHLCQRCASLTDSPMPDRCGRCQDWPDYDTADPTIGDLARLAEHLYGTTGEWTRVVMGLGDAFKAHRLLTGGIRWEPEQIGTCLLWKY